MATYEEIERALKLAKMYEEYATPERILTALKKVDKDAYDALIVNAAESIESEYADTFKKVKVQLLADAEAEKAAKAKRAADMKAKRAAKRKAADAAKSEATVQQKTDAKQEEKRGLSAQELVQQQRAQEQSVQQKQAQNQQSVQQKQDAQKQSVQTQKDDAHDAKPAQTAQQQKRPSFGGIPL